MCIRDSSQGVERAKDGFLIRRNAIETGVNVLTAMDTAKALITSLENTDIKKLTLVDIAAVKKMCIRDSPNTRLKSFRGEISRK